MNMKTRFLLASFLFFLTGCGYHKQVPIPTYRYDNAKVAELSAKAHVAENPEVFAVHQNVCCGSMRPTIQEGDWVVTAKVPFTDDLKGKAVVYRPKWRQGMPVLHRLVAGDAKDGFIASGDNTPRSEASERVRADNFDSEVVAVYRYVGPGNP